MSGVWKSFANPPSFPVSAAMLLTDGSVFCQSLNAPEWWRLVPDRYGDYGNGTWFPCKDSPSAPLFYASAVLADGTVFVAGGEYNGGKPADLLAASRYDPQVDAWTPLPVPNGWTKIGDAASCVLPDGKVLVGAIDTNACAIFDPKSNSWNATGSKLNATSNEESWVLLPDGSVLTVDCFGGPGAEIYSNGRWTMTGAIPAGANLVATNHEIGPAVLLLDGRALVIGATGKTALYSPDSGTWAAGPAFPTDTNSQPLGAVDAPACLLPNGKVLCAVGPAGSPDAYAGPITFFEFDPNKNRINKLVNQPIPHGGNDLWRPYWARLLMLPNGTVLLCNGTIDLQLYVPDSGHDLTLEPLITSCPSSINRDEAIRIEGQRFNGMSQCCAYGDDAAMATNYPLVRMTSTDNETVRYCRTFNHSTMAVATGNKPVSTTFVMPNDVPNGSYSLSVVANGISSASQTVAVVGKMVPLPSLPSSSTNKQTGCSLVNGKGGGGDNNAKQTDELIVLATKKRDSYRRVGFFQEWVFWIGIGLAAVASAISSLSILTDLFGPVGGSGKYITAGFAAFPAIWGAFIAKVRLDKLCVHNYNAYAKLDAFIITSRWNIRESKELAAILSDEQHSFTELLSAVNSGKRSRENYSPPKSQDSGS